MIRQGCDVHVGGELAKGLVEVVHLCENAADDHDDKDIGRGVCELVVAGKGHLQRNAKRLDKHDGNGAGCGADGQVDQRVLAAVLGCDLVDHEDREDGNEEAVNKEACEQVSNGRVYVHSARRTRLEREVQDLIN